MARDDADWTDAERRYMCAAHLADLRRAHGRPPPDVQVAETIPTFVPPPITWSSTGSPAAKCADDRDAEADGGSGHRRPTPAVTLARSGNKA